MILYRFFWGLYPLLKIFSKYGPLLASEKYISTHKVVLCAVFRSFTDPLKTIYLRIGTVITHYIRIFGSNSSLKSSLAEDYGIYLHWWQMLPQLEWTCSSLFYTFFFLIKNADVYKEVLFLYVLCNYCFSVSGLSIKFPVEVNHFFIYSAQKSVMPSKWFMIFHIIFLGPSMMCATKKTDNRN